MEYKSPFVDEVPFETVLTGVLPDELDADDLEALIAYLHLAGKFREEHRELFKLAAEDREREDPWDPYRLFADLREDIRTRFQNEGHAVPPSFEVTKSVAYETQRQADDGSARSITRHRTIRNCQIDAYRTARDTFLDRRSTYGSGSAELSRWIDAQIKVFNECDPRRAGGVVVGTFEPPAEPDPGWQPLEQHDRRYQIAAAYFYNGQYLEAASRFSGIAQTPESPWRDIARYLVPRSIAREAIVNENEHDYHLQLAIDGYRELADDPDYLAAFPSVNGQIRYLETQRDPLAMRRSVEQLIVDHPEQTSAQDLRDFVYLWQQWNAWSFDDESSDFERWRYLLGAGLSKVTVDHWREKRTLPWLYLALVKADSRLEAATLVELLQASDAVSRDTPGFFNILLQRVRLLGLLGESAAAARVLAVLLESGLPQSDVNRLRLAAAEGAPSWTGYFRWAPVKALSLPWTDGFARRLPPSFNRITTDTPLFSQDAARLLNRYFTPKMILELIDTPGLGNYLRGRMAIAGWTRAMLTDDIDTALKLSSHIRRNVPGLEADLAVFEAALDKHFEAARIIFAYPAFSPWMRSGTGRARHWRTWLDDGTFRDARPTPDYVADGMRGLNWWCASSDDTIQRFRVSEYELQHPRFSHYSEPELESIKQLVELRRTAATTSFGPHVIRYAKENLDDPRIPRTLHRLVFATHHACYGAPGEISQAAFALLHKHFPDSEWAEKTPYWYD